MGLLHFEEMTNEVTTFKHSLSFKSKIRGFLGTAYERRLSGIGIGQSLLKQSNEKVKKELRKRVH